MAHKFDLNLLRIFSAAYESQSVTRAAEHLDLTQSAISNALNRLKANVNQELFTRTGRGIKPTQFSDDLYQRLQNPLLEIESMLEGIEHFDPYSSTKRFTIYCHEAMFHPLRKNLDISLKDFAPSVTLMELPSNEQTIYDDLRDEKVDLVIDIGEPESCLFHAELIFKQRLNCITRQDHPRISPSTINKESYLLEQHATYDVTRVNLKFVDWITDEVLPQRTIYSEHKSLLGMIASVSYSDAIGVVPESLAQQYQQAFNLQLLEFPFATKDFNSYMISLSKKQNNKATIWLRSIILSTIKISL
ncbi:LysR family transcriptional regulator [uncultured Shewanella sp.]|uniref:LysR family transcriptional regulator n=1 Tax=uncultured Shewanella sp. TaxID=173975 RepID=UPI00261EE733|nr:LysR family transcriptional regulator [uncultured Shewanella sp.]